MPIERVQIFCRNPILFVNSSADLLHHVSAEQIGLDLESRNEAQEPDPETDLKTWSTLDADRWSMLDAR